MCKKLHYVAFLILFLMVFWDRKVSAQTFPYQISVETVPGHCYDDGHLIFTILDGNGNAVQIDPQTHNAVNTAQYPLYNVQYHYQNAASGLGVQYDYSNDIMLTAGTYNVGVRANIPAQSGGYVLVDTTIYNVHITTSYQPMQASTLSNLCTGYSENGVEMYGYWPSFRCKDMGRIQLYITNGTFPYVVTILNEQQDTVRHIVFNHRVNNSNSIYSAQYRDYYTFDNLPIGTYSIIVMDSCGYVSQLSFDIPDYEPTRYYALVPTSNSVCSDGPVINFELERRRSFSDYSTSWYENVLPYVDSILLYRFVNPGHDTTEWRNMVSQIYNYGHWVYFNDTLPNYCVMYNDTIKVQFYDLCMDSLMTFSFKFLPQFDFIDSTDIVHFSDSAIQDTCAVHLLSGFSTQTYKIACDTWEDANKTYYGGSGYVAGIPIRYYNCPLSYDVWSLPDSTLLGHSQSDEFTGMGTWLTFDVDTSVQVHISVTDALGCQVAEKDTVLVYDVEPLDDLLFWYECHNDKDDDGHDHCCLDRYLWIQEHGVNADNFRRNMTLHLIESPLYNQFNFTAVRQEGVWTVTPDDPDNQTTYVEFSYEDGWRATVRDSVCLPPGRYTFEVSTDCGVDTITYSWAGYYYDTLDFVSAPEYDIQQVCDHIVVTQVSTGLEHYMYFMDPDVSNDIPIETIPSHVCTNYSSQGGTHYKDSQGRNVLTFSIPGTYIITNYAYNWPYTNCTDWCSEYHYHYDTVTVAFSHLDFDMAAALLCDSSSEAGTVSAQAINGNAPYTYTLYDQGGASGNVIASNSSGLFENVPMTEGQLFSVSVTDSCMTSFSVNISASVLKSGNLLWEQGANAGIPHCMGDSVHLAAMSFLDPATYQWTDPSGYSITTQTNEIVLYDNNESGWYTVEILNSFCGPSISDSIYITVRNLMPQTDTVYLCENDSVTIVAQHSPPFLWSTGDTTQSITVSEIGDYSVSLLDVFGCYYDSTVHVSLIPAIPVTPLFVTVLENDLPYTLNDSSYQTEGSYTQTLTSTAGCDSVLTLELTVLYNISVSIDSTICANELPFIWNDSVFSEEGTKTTIIPASNNVDSIISMTLHTQPIPPAHISGSSILCPDSSGIVSVDSAAAYLWNNGDTTQSITVSTNGHYSVTVTDEYGCVNTATHKVIHMIVNPIEAIQIPAVCAGGSDTVVVGRDQECQILIGQYDTIPPLSDAVMQSDNILTAGTEVSLVEVESPWMESVGDTMFVFSVPAGLPHDTIVTGVIHLYNAFGCSYDTTVSIVCHSQSQTEFDTTVCDLFIWNGVSYTTTGQYMQTLDNVNGCDSVVTVNLTVIYTPQIYDTLVLVQNQLPYYFAPTDTTFGVNSASTIAFSYWRTNDQGCDSLCNQTVIIYQNTQHAEDTTVCASALPFTWHGHIFTDAGSHTDTLLTVHGSDSVCTYTLMVDLLSASVGSPTHIVCYGASTGAASAVVTSGTAPLSYQWTGPSGTTVSTSVQISNQPAGFYTFTVTDQLGCSATDTVTLRTLNGELLPGSIADNQDVCEGDLLAAFTGTAASGGDNSVYQWQLSTDNTDWGTAPGVSNSQNYDYPNEASTGFHLRRAWISQSCGTVYSNIVTVTVGVNSRDTIRAQVCQNTPYSEFGFDISADETAVPGIFTFENHYAVGICDSVVVLMLTVNAPSSTELTVDECGSYVWNGVTYYESGSYEQTLINAAGCDSLVQLQLTLLDTEVEIVPLTENFCEEMSAELSVITELTDYLWSTGEEGPNITVTMPGTYSVTASQGDCRNSASYTINPCEYQVFMPNAITPSQSEGLNDWFAVPATIQSAMHSFEIRIFNRWGEQVFYSTDKNFRWSGEVKGKIYYNTVYTYIIRYTDAIGKPYCVKGSVMVL